LRRRLSALQLRHVACEHRGSVAEGGDGDAGSGGRVSPRSAPTRGQRRKAFRIRPFCPSPVEMAPRTVARIRGAAVPFAASRLASNRISSRSALRPRTSNRDIPRSLRRLRELWRARPCDVLLTARILYPGI